MVVLLAAAGAHGRSAAVTVTVTVTTTGAGAVDVSTEKNLCRDTCNVTLLAGQRLTLKARPDADNHLDAWSGACVGAALDCELVVNEALTVRAAFATGKAAFPGLSRLQIVVSGRGRVVSDPPGTIDCPGTCSARISSNATVALNAAPDANARFVGWSGSCSGTGPCTLALSAHQQAVAVFGEPSVPPGSSVITLVNRSPTPPNLPGLIGTGIARVTTPAGSSTCTLATCTYTVANGSTVTFEAQGNGTPGWQGACVGSGALCSLVVSQAVTATLSWSTTPNVSTSVGVVVSRTPGGQVTSAPAGIKCGDPGGCVAGYDDLTKVALTATADPGYTFLGWGLDCSGTGPCNVVVDVTRQVTARFARCAAAAPIPFTLSVTKKPRRVTAFVTPAGPADVTVRLVRRGFAVAPAITRKAAVGRTSVQLNVPSTIPRTSYATMRVEVQLSDACGGTKKLSRPVNA